jgi:excisionase family DNA binding protein
MERALSIRAIGREYGVSRDRVGEAIRSGELPAAPLGVRRFAILRSDFEAWLQSHPKRTKASNGMGMSTS